MIYKISIPNIIDIATCDNLKAVYDALIDSGCIRSMSIKDVLDMADRLERDDYFIAPVANDKRYSFIVKRVIE